MSAHLSPSDAPIICLILSARRLVGEPCMVQQVFSGHVHLDDQTVAAWKMMALLRSFSGIPVGKNGQLWTFRVCRTEKLPT
ncbi:hypothetical protein [Streptomyces sp. AC154]|uniref:hypothetical protein n=1 Tax=Streptomyces sp. AC154 TaxID=3143184 RepID=UPI003F80CA24